MLPGSVALFSNLLSISCALLLYGLVGLITAVRHCMLHAHAQLVHINREEGAENEFKESMQIKET